jgi:hypothetical protein
VSYVTKGFNVTVSGEEVKEAKGFIDVITSIYEVFGVKPANTADLFAIPLSLNGVTVVPSIVYEYKLVF